MRFADFLRATVLLSAGAATTLGAVSIAAADASGDLVLLTVALAWWAIAAMGGGWIGRGARPSAGIARLLASARSAPALPEVDPGRMILNRLWPVVAVTLLAGGLAFLLPQVPAVATGYLLILALAWRKQARAVAAIEDRDGVRFYMERTSPFKPTRLLRTPGLRKLDAPPARNGRPERVGGASRAFAREALHRGDRPRRGRPAALAPAVDGPPRLQVPTREPRLRSACNSGQERVFATWAGVNQARRAVATP